MNFERTGFEVVRNAVSEDVAKLLSIQFEMTCTLDLNSIRKPLVSLKGDTQVPLSYSIYSAMCFEATLVYLKDKVENVTGKTLLPAFSYARMYYHGATLPPHIDRPSCQYSATLAVRNGTYPWELSIKSLDGTDYSITLDDGDMLVYRGDKLEHSRSEYKGDRHYQAFLHYVDKNGEYADYAYDNRRLLGTSQYSK